MRKLMSVHASLPPKYPYGGAGRCGISASAVSSSHPEEKPLILLVAIDTLDIPTRPRQPGGRPIQYPERENR